MTTKDTFLNSDTFNDLGWRLNWH